MVIELKPLAYRWEQGKWRCEIVMTPGLLRWVLLCGGGSEWATEAQGWGLDLADATMRAQKVLALLTEGL